MSYYQRPRPRKRGLGPAFAGFVFVVLLVLLCFSGVAFYTAPCDTLGRFMRAYELPARCNATVPAVVVDTRR